MFRKCHLRILINLVNLNLDSPLMPKAIHRYFYFFIQLQSKEEINSWDFLLFCPLGCPSFSHYVVPSVTNPRQPGIVHFKCSFRTCIHIETHIFASPGKPLDPKSNKQPSSLCWAPISEANSSLCQLFPCLHI